MSATPTHSSGPALAAVALCVATALGAVIADPGLFMVDDAWFYLQIGHELATTGRSTFDGLHTTDGYHPLWLGLVAVLASVAPGKDGLFALALGVQLALAPLTLLLLHRTARRAAVPFPELALVALLLTQIADRAWMTEGPLTAFLHVALLAVWLEARFALAGALAGLLFLCRLDTVFFLGAVVALTPARGRLPLLAAATAVASPWVAGHLVWTGHLVPVSGALKSTFPVPDLSDLVAKIGWTGILAVAGSVCAVVLGRRRRDDGERAMLALGLGGLVHGLYVGLFTGSLWSTFVAYYWITGVLATGLALGHLAVRYLALLPSLPPQRGRQLVLAVAVFFAGVAAARSVRSVALHEPDPMESLARWVHRELPPEARILALDAPGRLAWFSGRTVFAMDGLTQSHGFSDDLRPGIDAWAAANGVTHVLTYAVPFDAPWCAIRVQDGEPTVTFRAPDTREAVGEHTFTGAPLVRLADFETNPEVNWASLYPWP
ncbi:MAG: hypothetical protein H6736_21300 [Alphaproteobacteria bacterium]|nr:hypothetical protein [Alphaproteobacteria bacterium]MCB9694354.1 hypothetical protein [Alphaproteobacteria bacterium]